MTLSLAFEINEYLSLIQVKKRYDGTAKLWRELPTDAELSAKQNQAEGSSEVQMRVMIVCHNCFVLLDDNQRKQMEKGYES